MSMRIFYKQPEFLFLFFAVILGAFSIVVTPPFQIPDEPVHFYRAYQIADGGFLSKREGNRLGGDIPNSIKNFSESYKYLKFNKYSKTNKDSIFSKADIKLNKNDVRFVDFPYMANYTPFTYLPQFLAIFFLKSFDAKPFYIYYLAKIFALLFWLTVVFFSIKIIPVYKWLIAILALLPMNVFINSSLSADSVTNAVSFFTVSYILFLALKAKKVREKEFVFLLILSVLLSLLKIVYFPLIFLIFIIPKSKFISEKRYYTYLFSVIFSGFFIAFSWILLIKSQSISYIDYNTEYRKIITLGTGSSLSLQLSYIKSHLLETIVVFINSYIDRFENLSIQYIAYLGWIDTIFPMWYIIFSYLIIFIFVISESEKKYSLRIKNKAIILSVFVLIAGLIELSQYLTWNAVGKNDVAGLQGRYFIPLLPLFFLLLLNTKIISGKNFRLIVFFIFVSVTSFIFSKTLLERYYPKYSNYEKVTEIYCNSENTDSTNKHFLTNNENVLLNGGLAKSSDFAFSGNFSAKTNKEKPFVFTHRLFSVKKGDLIKISVRRKGEFGHIVIDGPNNEAIYLADSKIYNNVNGWEFLQTNFYSPVNLENDTLSIYIWNPKTNPSYFDDFKIELYKPIDVCK